MQRLTSLRNIACPTGGGSSYSPQLRAARVVWSGRQFKRLAELLTHGVTCSKPAGIGGLVQSGIPGAVSSFALPGRSRAIRENPWELDGERSGIGARNLLRSAERDFSQEAG